MVRALTGPTALLVAALAVKGLLVLVDPSVRLFLGDSASYLYAATHAWDPADRSFTYPWLIRTLVHPLGSLQWLLLWQSLAGVMTALLLYWTARAVLGAPRWLAFIAGLLLAVGPAQLFYERMVMAEAFGMLAFAAFCSAGLAYARFAHPGLLLAAVVLGLAAISLRLNLAPVVVVMSLLLAWLPLTRPGIGRLRQSLAICGRHFALAAIAVVVAHGAFMAYVGQKFHQPPGYTGRTGFMRMGLVAPLMRPADFVAVGLPADFADHLAFDLHDPDTRTAQMWMKGGLAHRIKARGLDVNRIGARLADRALRRDPLGLVRLGLHTLTHYFDPAAARLRLDRDLARDPPYPSKLVAAVAGTWHIDIKGLTQRDTPVRTWFEISAPLLVFFLFALIPLAVVAVVLNRHSPTRPAVVALALIATGMVMSEVLFSVIASYRYLQSLPFVVILVGVAIAASARNRKHPQDAGCEVAVRQS